ncbi:MAG: response regulator [Acidobacteriota bacterium]
MERLRVLLVDDEEELVSTMVERLRLRDIEADAETDGYRALDRVMASDYDVVLVDVKMPGLGGMELLGEIRKERPDVPVILLTGHTAEQEGVEGMRIGAFDYLMKPINIDDLILRMRDAAGRRQG